VKRRLVFVDRLLATLVSLRQGTTHDVLARWFGVGRSTITRAIGEVWPLLAQQGGTAVSYVRVRLRTSSSAWESAAEPASSTKLGPGLYAATTWTPTPLARPIWRALTGLMTVTEDGTACCPARSHRRPAVASISS